MAQDIRIYESVCVVHGHDLFVLGDPTVSADRLALCKRCGTEVGIGKAQRG